MRFRAALLSSTMMGESETTGRSIGPGALATLFPHCARGEAGRDGWFCREHLHLHTAFGAGFLVQRARGYELAAFHKVGRQSDFNHRRCPHTKTTSADRRAVRMFAEERGVEAKAGSSRRESALTFLLRSLSDLTSAATQNGRKQR